MRLTAGRGGSAMSDSNDDSGTTVRIRLHGLDAQTVAVAPGTTVQVS